MLRTAIPAHRFGREPFGFLKLVRGRVSILRPHWLEVCLVASEPWQAPPVPCTRSWLAANENYYMGVKKDDCRGLVLASKA